MRNLVEMHGGHVSAASPGLGLGQRAIGAAPTGTPVAAEIEAHEDPPCVERPAKRKRVLIVGRQPRLVETMEMVLAQSGYDVRVAYDGAQALEAAGASCPTWASSISACRAWMATRSRVGFGPRWPGKSCGLVAVTGYGQEADRRCAMRAGFDAHLVKPVELDAILRELAVEQAG